MFDFINNEAFYPVSRQILSWKSWGNTLVPRSRLSTIYALLHDVSYLCTCYSYEKLLVFYDSRTIDVLDFRRKGVMWLWDLPFISYGATMNLIWSRWQISFVDLDLTLQHQRITSLGSKKIFTIKISLLVFKDHMHFIFSCNIPII